MTAESIETTATVTMEKLDVGFTVTKVHLDVHAKIPGADAAAGSAGCACGVAFSWLRSAAGIANPSQSAARANSKSRRRIGNQ
jgi:hypothetical protein